MIPKSRKKSPVLTADTECCSVLSGLSAAFDTADHTILIDCLQQCVGICWSALRWNLPFLKQVVSPAFTGKINPPAATVKEIIQSHYF